MNNKPPIGVTIILILLGLVSLGFAFWAGTAAFEDTSSPVSALAMMGMMGYIFHAAVIFVILKLSVKTRRLFTLLLLVWHIPEAILIGLFGMGVPDGRLTGVIIHGVFSLLALISWNIER